MRRSTEHRRAASIVLVVLLGCSKEAPLPEPSARAASAPLLHWFIPDGMRADPELFDVYAWAEQGLLPNLAKLMEQGTYGFAVPTFPSHTPTNFATLLTGASPRVHGVADGPMHVEGFPLKTPSVGGFRSTARKVPALWSVLEERGHQVVLLSVPGATPPELSAGGITIRGRWGGWGADLDSLIFESASEEQSKRLARARRLFFLGEELTRFCEPAAELGWELAATSFSAPIPLELEVFGARISAALLDTRDDGERRFDRIAFAPAGGRPELLLAQGEWSDWIPIEFQWRDRRVPSRYRLHPIKLEGEGFFRLRMLLSNINPLIVAPDHLAEDVCGSLEPMVDFVDNFPPQLVHYPEDKRAFLDELGMSLAWHERAVRVLHRERRPDVFIHNVYSPNQMLTSRWWLGHIDPASARYGAVSDRERERLWEEVRGMYAGLDAILGAALEQAGERTVLVLSSDHGAAALDRTVRLNNLFHAKGWLAYSMDPRTHEPVIDWERTRVVYLKMCHVYVSPEGLGGDWKRSSGPAYEALRDEVRAVLESLEDADGRRPLAALCTFEEAGERFQLPPERVGDLVIANRAGFGWNEEIEASGAVFEDSLVTGYKQAILADEVPALWAPFLIAGPGIRKGHRLSEPVRMMDQLPTILRALGEEIPAHVEGRVLQDVFE